MKQKLINAVKVLIIGTLLTTGFYWGMVGYDELNPVRVYEQNELRSNIRLKDGTYVEVDKKLEPHAVEFFEEAYKYNFPVDNLFKNYSGLHIEILPRDKAGTTIFTQKGTFSLISTSIIYNYNRTRSVVFHELAHVLFPNREHCHWMCPQIFAANSSVNYYGINWKVQKAILFKNIPHYGDEQKEKESQK